MSSCSRSSVSAVDRRRRAARRSRDSSSGANRRSSPRSSSSSPRSRHRANDNGGSDRVPATNRKPSGSASMNAVSIVGAGAARWRSSTTIVPRPSTRGQLVGDRDRRVVGVGTLPLEQHEGVVGHTRPARRDRRQQARHEPCRLGIRSDRTTARRRRRPAAPPTTPASPSCRSPPAPTRGPRGSRRRGARQVRSRARAAGATAGSTTWWQRRPSASPLPCCRSYMTSGAVAVRTMTDGTGDTPRVDHPGAGDAFWRDRDLGGGRTHERTPSRGAWNDDD